MKKPRPLNTLAIDARIMKGAKKYSIQIQCDTYELLTAKQISRLIEWLVSAQLWIETNSVI